MRLAGGAHANSAIAERKPDSAFGFPEGVTAGLNPQAPAKGRAQTVEFYALKTSDDLRV
jgi:hypothetical protein